MGGSSLYPPEAPSLKPAFWQDLAIRNPFGVELTEQHVMDWFYLVAYLRYRTYGYRRHAIMIMRWWAGASLADVRQAGHIRLRREAGDKLVIVPVPVQRQPARMAELPRQRGGRQRRKDSPEPLADMLDSLFHESQR